MYSAADTAAYTARLSIVPGLPPNLSRETGRRLEDLPHPAVRAASARARSAATTTVERPGPIHRAEAPAWAAADLTVAEGLTAVAAGVIDRNRSVSSDSLKVV